MFKDKQEGLTAPAQQCMSARQSTCRQYRWSSMLPQSCNLPARLHQASRPCRSQRIPIILACTSNELLFLRKLCRGTGSLIRKRGGGRSNDTSAGRERLRKGCRLGTPSRSNSSVAAGPSVKPFRYSANPASNTPVSALKPLRHFHITQAVAASWCSTGRGQGSQHPWTRK